MTLFRNRSLAGVLVLLAATPAAAQTFPLHLKAPGGEVILPTKGDQKAHDNDRYAAARRVGDFVYLSGVVIRRPPGGGSDVESFKAQTRQAFDRIRATLAAAGATFQDIALISSFHVWQSPDFAGSRDEQFKAFDDVVGEYIKPPYPAWTAVGTTGLLSDTGIVEIQLTAYAPVKRQP